MREHTDNSKLSVKHIYKSDDKSAIQKNLNSRMEKVVMRYLKKPKASS